MAFEWDESKRRTNHAKHGLDFADLEKFDWSDPVTFADEAEIVAKPGADRTLAYDAIQQASPGFGATRYRTALSAASQHLAKLYIGRQDYGKLAELKNSSNAQRSPSHAWRSCANWLRSIKIG